MTDVGGDSRLLFDEVIKASAEQWCSVIDECEMAGWFVCPIDEVRCHWFLIPMSVLEGPDH